MVPIFAPLSVPDIVTDGSGLDVPVCGVGLAGSRPEKKSRFGCMGTEECLSLPPLFPGALRCFFRRPLFGGSGELIGAWFFDRLE